MGEKLSQQSVDSTIADTDIFYKVQDPTGTPGSEAVTWATIKDNIPVLATKTYSGTSPITLDISDNDNNWITLQHVTPSEDTTINLPTWAAGHPGWMTVQIRNNGVGHIISFGGTNYVLEPNVNLSRTPQPTFFMNWDPVASKWRVSDIGIDAEADLSAVTLTDAGVPADTDQVLIKDAATGALQTADFSDFGGGAPDGTYDSITHSAAAALNLDFNQSDWGWKVTASANITDITTSNGPASGNLKRRVLEIVAIADITIVATTALTDASIPANMANGDKVLVDVVEIV